MRSPRSARSFRPVAAAAAGFLLLVLGGAPLLPAAGAESQVAYSVTDVGEGTPVALAANGRALVLNRSGGVDRSFVAYPPANPAESWVRVHIVPPVGTSDPYDFVTAVDMNTDGVVIGATIEGPFRWTEGVREDLSFPGPPAPHTPNGCDQGTALPPLLVEWPYEAGRPLLVDPITYQDPSALLRIGKHGLLLGRSGYQVHGFDTQSCPRPERPADPATSEELLAYAAAYDVWNAKLGDWAAHQTTWANRSFLFLGSPVTAPDASLAGTDDFSFSDLGEGGHLVGLRDGRPYRFSGGSGAAYLDVPPQTFESYQVSAVNAAGEVAGAFTPATGADRAIVWLPDGTRRELPSTDPALDARALGINDQGEVVGEISEFMILERNAFAALWDGGGVTDLNTLVQGQTIRIDDDSPYSLRLQKAVAINDAGQILCVALVLPGEVEKRAVVLTPLCDTFSVNPLVVDFGDIEVGRTAAADAVVTNCTDAAFVVRSGRLTPPFRLAGGARKKVTAGAAVPWRLAFKPAAEGTFSKDLTFTGPDGLQSTIRLTGRGVLPGPQLFAFPDPLEFGFAVRGVREYPLLIQNLRDEPVRVTFGDVAPPFRNEGPRSVTIAARATLSREIAFLPTGRGEFTGTMTLTTNVRGAPVQTVSFRGQLATSVRIRRITGGGADFRKLPGDWADATEDLVLDEGTEISTDPDTEVELEFPDGSTTVIRRATHMKVAALFTKGGLVRSEIELKVGELAAKVRKGDVVRSDFVIRGPEAVASVRGTDFDVICDETAGTTTVVVREGVVEVDPVTNGLRTVRVKAGRQVTVSLTAIGPVKRVE